MYILTLAFSYVFVYDEGEIKEGTIYRHIKCVEGGPLRAVQRKRSDKEVDLTYEMDAKASCRCTGEDSECSVRPAGLIDSNEREVTKMLDTKNSEE